MKSQIGGGWIPVGKIWQCTLIIVLLLLGFSACSTEKEELDITSDYDYFPLEVGRYWVYEVDSIIYTSSSVDSSRTYFREEIVESFPGNAGDTLYRVERFKRPSTSQPWQIADVFSLSRTREQAFQTENNVRLVKLVFPLRRPDGWNSTAYVDPRIQFFLGGEMVDIFSFWDNQARIDSIGQPYQLGLLQFPETAKVTYTNRDDVRTLYRYAVERYAKGVGMVQRDWEIFNGLCNDSIITNCNRERWREIAQEGFIISQRLIEYE